MEEQSYIRYADIICISDQDEAVLVKFGDSPIGRQGRENARSFFSLSIFVTKISR